MLSEISDTLTSDYYVKPVQEKRSMDMHDICQSWVCEYSQDILWRLEEIFRRDNEGFCKSGIDCGGKVRETLRETYSDSYFCPKSCVVRGNTC